MFNLLTQRVQTEWRHFQELGPDLQRVMLSHVFYLMAKPILEVFMSAFLWRQDRGALLVILYYSGWVIGLPIGFLINGILLKKVHVTHLYFIGTVFQGAGAGLAIFSQALTTQSVLLYGILFGFTSAFLWANKNSLGYVLSKSKNRLYYNSFEALLRLIIGMIVPFLVGWFITMSADSFATHTAYKLLIVVASLLLAVSGLLLKYSHLPDIHISSLWLPKNVSHRWRMARLATMLYSSLFGINLFYPALLVLYLGATEGVLGTIQSIMQLLAVAGLYLVARKMQQRHILPYLQIVQLIYLAGVVLLLWQFNWQLGLGYLLAQVLFETTRWNSIYTLILGTMDKELTEKKTAMEYAYVFDTELYINLGRLLGIGVFLTVLSAIDLITAMRWVPLVFIGLQFLLAYPLKQLLADRTTQVQS